MKFTFKYEYKSKDYPNTKVVLTTDANTLPEILEEFTNFLNSCGFSTKGDLVFTDEED